MGLSRDSFGAALMAVRTRMRSGRFVLGEQLVVSELTRDLGLSATPVREALSRLAGEGLIEDRRGAGYFAWRTDAVDLSELYHLQGVYLTAAVERLHEANLPGVAHPERQPTAAGDPLARTEALLLGLVQHGRSLHLMRAHQLLADRLAPARRVEGRVVGHDEQERREMARALASGAHGDLMSQVEAYTRRRKNASGEIVAAMRSIAVSEDCTI